MHKSVLHVFIFAITIVWHSAVFAQAGDVCSTAIPLTANSWLNGQTTCGANDDFNGTTNCSYPPAAYTVGPDMFYTFTPVTTAYYQIHLANTTSAYCYGSVTVFEGCPTSSSNATNCVGGGLMSMSSSPWDINTTLYLTAGVTYYIMADNHSPNSPCWNYNICVISVPPITIQPPCTNLGFENDTTGWFYTLGQVSGETGMPSPDYNPLIFSYYPPYTEITTGSGTDPYGGFPIVFSGSKSLRIGDVGGTGASGNSVEQSFMVTTANSNFTYNYAVVVQDPTHPVHQQPFFKVEVFDGSNNPITCGNYLVTAPGTDFVQSTVDATVWYKAWTPVSINLLNYIGQNVRVKFTAGDCTEGAHFGYAYVDCSCSSYSINSDTICAGESTVLSAPVGALSYSWSPGGGTTPSITVSPTVTTTYTCTITTQGNTPCIGDFTTTVTVNPTTLLSVSATDTIICQGQSTVLTASGGSSYTWSPATGLSSTTGATVTASPTVTTTYTVTDNSGGSCGATGTFEVIVNPATPLSVSATDTIICQGQSTLLTVSGGSSYTWSPATGLSSTTGATVTASPTVTTTYTVTNNSSCGASGAFEVTVNPTPIIDVNSPTICTGESTTLTASGANSYTWSPATGLSSTTGASVTANPTVTTTYTVTGTTAEGCTATATSTVTVGSTSTITVNSATICEGQSTTLTASGASSYTWSPATGLSSITGESVTASPTVTTTYTVTSGSGTCLATATSTVTVHPIPTISVNSEVICFGQNATLVAVPSPGGGSFSWTPGGQSSSTITVEPAITSNYTVTYTLNGCSASATGTVTVNSGANATISATSTVIDEGETILLTAGNADSYLWNSGETTQTISVSPTESTNYCVTVNEGGCVDSTCIGISVGCESTIFAPNVITADGDGTNEVFIVHTYCLIEYHLFIVNRWGELIFETWDINDYWDGTYKGKPVCDGVYTYVIIARGGDNQFHKLHGFVTVLR